MEVALIIFLVFLFLICVINEAFEGIIFLLLIFILIVPSNDDKKKEVQDNKPKVEQQASDESVKSKYCSSCGYGLTEDSKFCSKCGKEVK